MRVPFTSRPARLWAIAIAAVIGLGTLPALGAEPAPTASPIVPIQLTLDEKFQFRCHKGIACFNQCCHNIDIMLTPYDVLRLKKRFGVTAREFIENETVDFTMDGQGMPGLKLRMQQGSTQCVNLTPQGCGVYEDRPAACRA